MVLDEVLNTQALAATITGVILLSCALLMSLALLVQMQRTTGEIARLPSIDAVLARCGQTAPEFGVKVRATFGLPSSTPPRAPPRPAQWDRPAAGRRGGSSVDEDGGYSRRVLVG